MSNFNCWTRVGEEGVEKCNFSEVINLLDSNNVLECDLETYGLVAVEVDIMSIQFGAAGREYLIEWHDDLVPILREYFLSDRKFIFVNAKFDLGFLLKYGLVIKNVYDLFLVEKIITNDGMKFHRASLKALAKKYLDKDLDKTIRASIPELGLTTEVISYALDDVKYLTSIAREQAKIVNEFDLAEVVRLENKFVSVLAYTEFCGIKLDADQWIKVYEENAKKQLELLAKLTEMVMEIPDAPIPIGYDIFSNQYVCHINWESSQQVLPLMRFLGVNTTVDVKGSIKESVDAKVLEKYKDTHKLIPVYLEYKETTHAMQSFGKDYIKNINPLTGRIHTSFTQLMGTGRLSCGNSKEGERSPNLQQVPADEKYRRCFIPENGNDFICTDYSGQEQIVFANLSMDPNLLEFYDKGLDDMHSYVAKMCFPAIIPSDMDLPEVKKKFPEERQTAKKAGFAINYGGNGYTIANNLNISKEQGEEIYKAYMEGFPGISDYFAKVSSEAVQNGYILCDKVFRRKFFLYGIEELKEKGNTIRSFTKADWAQYRIEKQKNSEKYINELKPLVSGYYKKLAGFTRDSYNYPCQSTGASMTKLACIKIWDYILENDLLFIVKLVNIVHDETTVECPKSISTSIAKVVGDIMEEAGEVFCKRIKVKAKPQIADSWVH